MELATAAKKRADENYFSKGYKSGSESVAAVDKAKLTSKAKKFMKKK